LGYRHGSYAFLPLAVLLVLIIGFAYLPHMGHAGSSDLTADSIWLEDASQPGQSISQVSSGQSFLIVATIKNIGQEAASGYYVDVYYDNDYGRGGPDNILAGEVQTWYVGPLTAQDGAHTIKWVVDPDNQIAELDETNNQKDYAFTVGSRTATTTATSSLTSSNPASSSTSTLTLISTAQGTQFLTSILTMTVTSYTATQISTSTIVVPATVIVGSSRMTTTAQTTQVLTSTGTTTVTGYTTTTVTSYTSTSTSRSTSVVYTTVASLAGAAASSPLAYLGFISLVAVAASQRAVAGRSRRIPQVPSHRRPFTVSSLRSLPTRLVHVRHCYTILIRTIPLLDRRCLRI
jgi:hypothetical protein